MESVTVAKGEEIVRRGVAQEVGDRRVEIAAPKNHQHVIDHVVDVDQVLISRIWCAIGIEALDFEITRIVEAIGGLHPQAIPGIEVSIGVRDDVSVVRVHLDSIVIVRIAAEVSGAEISLRPFIGVVDTPVSPVQIEMLEITMRAWLAHRQLRVPAEYVAQSCEKPAAIKTPRIILECAQIVFLKLRRTLRTESGVL